MIDTTKNKKILFRGKRVDNGEWVYGYYVFQRKRSGAFGQTVTELDCNKSLICSVTGDNYWEVIPETVGQYTGLDDAKGKNLFDGDIFVPYYVTPMGEVTKDLDYDSRGTIMQGIAAYVIKRGDSGPEFPLRAYVATEFDYYLPNFGEVYKYSNNVALGEAVGNIYDNK